MSLIELEDRQRAKNYTLVAIAQIGDRRYEADFSWEVYAWDRATKFFPMREDANGNFWSTGVTIKQWEQWSDRQYYGF